MRESSGDIWELGRVQGISGNDGEFMRYLGIRESSGDIWELGRVQEISGNEGEFRIYLGIREEVTGEWRKMCSEQLHDLQSPPTVTRVVKRKTMR